jgi:DNA polymerase III alpha subunit
LPEFDLAERVRGELRACGLWFSAHPLDVFTDETGRRGAVPAASLATCVSGERVTLVGLRCAARRVETRQGGLMLFTTLADRSGLAECVLFPESYRAYADAVQASILRIEGRVDRTLDAVTVVVERAVALDAASLEPNGSDPRNENVMARDFSLTEAARRA